MKDGKRRQAEYARRLRDAGLRQVGVWVSDAEYEVVKQLSTTGGRGKSREAHSPAVVARAVAGETRMLLPLAAGGLVSDDWRRGGRPPLFCCVLGGSGDLTAMAVKGGASAPPNMAGAEFGRAFHEIGEKSEFTLDVAFVPAAIDQEHLSRLLAL